MKQLLSIIFITLGFIAPVHAESALNLLGGEKNKYKDVVIKEVVTVDTFILDKTGERIRLIGLRGPDELPTEVKQEREETGEFGFVMNRGK